MNFYKELELIIQEALPSEKFARFAHFYEAYKHGRVDREREHNPIVFHEPSFAKICQIVPPQIVPKRRKLDTPEGQILLIHAVAHIEYSAIDLALDAAYRFAHMPKEYYDDWLSVADDEIRHFAMLEALLHELGSSYGSVAVHSALFEAGERTQTLLERMAAVPRYLEANGLDATPLIIEKLQRIKSTPFLAKLITTLGIIVEEEVGHVQKGDRWFAWACEDAGCSRDIYFDIIEKYYPKSFEKPRPINAKARLAAGFSCSEITFIAKERLC